MRNTDFFRSQRVDAQRGHCSPCPQLPGTILRIFIPAGAEINLLNLIEIASPSGICLIVRLPLLCGGSTSGLNTIVDSIKRAGGSVEFVNK